MRNTFKFLLALAIAFAVMLAFRSLVMTVCMIEGDGLAPQFIAGDHVVVNRWSYGLRTGEKSGLFDYGRICRQDIKKGDYIAFEDSLGQVLICRCTALPGDTIMKNVVVPGLVNCADQDYYWVEPVGKNNPLSSRQLGFIPEQRIIGRACLVLYSREPSAPFWKGYRSERLLLPR
jgi:signal peptidase I